MKPRILLCGPVLTKDRPLLKLLRSKYAASTARDPRELVAAVRERRRDLVLFELSKSWGRELNAVQSLKARMPHVVVVVVDGSNSSDGVIRSFKLGADDCFRKPYSPFLLAERIEALLKKKQKGPFGFGGKE